MSTFDQFANQGGAAAWDPDAAEPAKLAAEQHLQNAEVGDLPEPLGSNPDDLLEAGDASSAGAVESTTGDSVPGRGYDPEFLGLPLELPASDAPAERLVELPYTHFTVVLDRERRLARLTAVNIDGAELLDLGRGDDWHFDERIAENEQAGPDVYARNDLDRGHLVRRRDPVWGDDAARANYDTFSYTNAAPQVNVINQSKELWLGLEDYVLNHADSTDERLSVFTGPVFDDNDPEYRGVQIPKKFFKIACWQAEGALACTGYLLDQGALLDSISLPKAWVVDDPPELGPFRTFQLAVAEIADLTGLQLEQFEAGDRFQPQPGLLPTDWTLLESYSDIRL